MRLEGPAAEILRLKAELTWVSEERDILNKGELWIDSGDNE